MANLIPFVVKAWRDETKTDLRSLVVDAQTLADALHVAKQKHNVPRYLICGVMEQRLVNYLEHQNESFAELTGTAALGFC